MMWLEVFIYIDNFLIDNLFQKLINEQRTRDSKKSAMDIAGSMFNGFQVMTLFAAGWFAYDIDTALQSVIVIGGLLGVVCLGKHLLSLCERNRRDDLLGKFNPFRSTMNYSRLLANLALVSSMVFLINNAKTLNAEMLFVWLSIYLLTIGLNLMACISTAVPTITPHSPWSDDDGNRVG